MTPKELSQAAHAYLEAAEFTDMTPDYPEFEDVYWHGSSIGMASNAIEDFIRALPLSVEESLESAMLGETMTLPSYDWGQLGHDLWLTRNHHGTGFWDRGLGGLGTSLTDIAHAMGEQHLYITSGEAYLVT